MCWIGTKTDKKIADRDIPVSKIVYKKNNEFYSVYHHFKYELNKVYKTDLTCCDCWANSEYVTISIGFHCWKANTNIPTLTNTYYIISSNWTGNCKYIGLISINAKILPECYDIAIIEGIIPKGSIYYINDMDDIVSESVMFTKQLKYIKVKNDDKTELINTEVDNLINNYK